MNYSGLKDIDYAVKIDYTTKVDGYVDDPTKISNKVTNDTGEDAHSEGTANQEGIVKNIDGSVDYMNREIPWKIDINNAGYMMENWHLTDTLSKGQTFLADSFQIMDKTTKQVVPANQYTLVATADGFTVAFKEPLKSGTDHQYQLTYKSHFETGSIDDGTGHEGDVTFNNGASMDWQDANGGKHHNETDENFDPKPAFKYNGQKSGDYNATTKKITWTVAVNYNQQELKNATIVDPISVKQNYVDGSTHLYEATINKDGSYTLGSEVQNAKITEPTKSKSEVKVNLPEGSHKAYVLVFETSLEGELIDSEQYKNTANFTNDGTSHDLSASVEAQHSGSIIEKTGEQDPDDSTYVKWDLTVNSSGSTLDNVHVKDTPSTNTYVSKEDVVVYGTKVDKDGKIEKDPSRILKEGQDYTLSITTDSTTGQQTIKVDFLNQIKTPYIIEYRGLITSDKANDTVSNHASIVAENNKVIK
ncbi:collagen binding domain-containing protein, partial [Latilactobacillus fuchuensis]|uniref:collagen binding domain-containing protein n=1 Tax=Latilactobacillus fuchuensis TaxID=164393 RepID=UPI0039B0B229